MRFRSWMPLFEFYLAIPFIEISTSIINLRHDMRVIEYLAWRIRVWKWEWRVGFFDYEKRRVR